MNDAVDYCKTCFHPEGFHIFTDMIISGGASENTVNHPCGMQECECTDFVLGETRVTSSTGASKGTKEARYDLIPIPALDQLARLYGKGAVKYAEHNWRLGYEWSKSYAAAQRHMAAFWSGENIDPETQIPHVICASFHMFALATYLTEHPEFDDRFETTHGIPQPSFQDILDASFGKLQDGTASAAEVLQFMKMAGSKDPIEEAAQWLAVQPEGQTITFDQSFTEDQIAQIFTRAAEIQKESHPDE